MAVDGPKATRALRITQKVIENVTSNTGMWEQIVIEFTMKLKEPIKLKECLLPCSSESLIFPCIKNVIQPVILCGCQT